MPEYFIHAASFAAPFMSDESTGYVTAWSPADALEQYAASYTHPAGLYAADCYASADAYHKGEKHLARWLCNKAQTIERATEGRGAVSIYSPNADMVEISGEPIAIRDPKRGSVVEGPTCA